MSFKITIEETSSVESEEQGPWIILQRVPWAPDEINEKVLRAYGDESKEKLLEKEPLKEVRGYAPARATKKTVCSKIFEQTVETLDLSSVIKAVNQI